MPDTPTTDTQAAKLTLRQRLLRLPRCPQSLYCDVMRAPGDLAIANRLGQRNRGPSERRDAMRQMAHAINALRRAERAAGIDPARPAEIAAEDALHAIERQRFEAREWSRNAWGSGEHPAEQAA